MCKFCEEGKEKLLPLDYATGKDFVIKSKLLICDDSTIMKHTMLNYELRNIDFQPIDESFYKYNYHAQFREFGISKRYKFKTFKIRRKRWN